MNVILTGSHKNNIGKTMISIKLAVELAKSGKIVLMMDLSSGKLKMSEYLNVNEDIIYDIVDVMKKTCTLEQGIIEINENLSLMPSPRIPGKINEINKESFINLLQ
ncbi:MAG: AAA family ATPase, partial [Tissierellia bacterium]|nr:AAA family ATPase [Tissierellia bacterium]